MSTFALSDQTFADIARSLQAADYTGNGTRWQLGLYGVDLARMAEYGASARINRNNKPWEGVDRLVGVWRANNARAYHARYLHIDEVRQDRTPKYNGLSWEKNKAQILEPAQLLKSLRCLRYNMDDHGCPILDQVINALKDQVIDNLPEYQAANWG